MNLFKTIQGTFAGADKDSIERLKKIKVGEVIRVTAEKRNVRQNRSTKQNGYYHGCVLPTICAGLGDSYSEKQLHTALKIGYFGSTVVKIGMIEIVEPKGSTTQLSTAQFEEFLKMSRGWASELRIYVPKPNEAGYEY
jgi:hypothetical protein